MLDLATGRQSSNRWVGTPEVDQLIVVVFLLCEGCVSEVSALFLLGSVDVLLLRFQSKWMMAPPNCINMNSGEVKLVSTATALKDNKAALWPACD